MSIAQPTLEDVWQLFRETDRKFQETDRLIKELFVSQKDTDQKFQDTDRKFKNTDEKIDRITESIGRLGGRLGDFVEEAVRPAAVRLFRERGIEVHEVYQNVKAERDGEGVEVDLLVVNDQDVVAVECKSKLDVDDVNEHLERLAKFKKLLPKYANSRLLGAVAGMVIPDAVAKYAYRQGLYVIAQSGDHVLIRNDDKFAPKAW